MRLYHYEELCKMLIRGKNLGLIDDTFLIKRLEIEILPQLEAKEEVLVQKHEEITTDEVVIS